MRFIKTIAIAALAAGIATAAQAQLKPDETKTLRSGLMLATKLQAGVLLGYAQGKVDVLPPDAAARAENVAALARISPSAWAKGTEAVDGKTKPEAFTSADFAKGFDTMGAEAAKLAEVIKGGNADAIKAQAGALGKTCKGCHDNFKKD